MNRTALPRVLAAIIVFTCMTRVAAQPTPLSPNSRAAEQWRAEHRLIDLHQHIEYKRLGLYLRDKEGKLIKIDDPKLDPVWKRCGELNMPVSIHVADPKAFWLPYNDQNERWKELKDHRSWWFGDPNIYPGREELLEALNR